jgi:hypothetical protein
VTQTETVDLEKVALKAMLKYIEFAGVSKTCPVCGGNQSHDSACVLAAFLYPEKAEIYKNQTHNTHIQEMLWHVKHDEGFAFLRNELSVTREFDDVFPQLKSTQQAQRGGETE